MAEEREVEIRVLGLAAMTWLHPEEAAQRLEGLLHLATRGGRPTESRPIPARHRLDILGRLVRETILGGPPEELPERLDRAERRDREYLIRFVREALGELQRLQRQTPPIPLGFPPEPTDLWSHLLDQGWTPMPAGALWTDRP